MSRLRRLKEQRRKNRIKATSCSLALALAIGSAQGLGTYALFSDTEHVPSDIALSTGDVDVEISEGFKKLDIKSGTKFTHELTISNNGTLKQNIGIALESSVDWISFKVDFIEEEIKDIEKLSTKPQSINNINGSLIILEPNTSIKANITVSVGTVPENIENQTKSFNIKTYASQINQDNSGVYNGFYDMDTQMNTIQFGKEDIITSEDDQIKIAGLGQNQNQFLEIDYISNDFPKPNKIQFIKGTGKFENAIVESKSNNTFEIHGVHVYDKNTKDYLLSDRYGVDTITIKFIYEGDVSKTIYFDFKSVERHGNRAAIAKYTTIQSQREEIEKVGELLESVEQSKEEIEKTTEPEVVEPPKEEIEAPTNPEVVEPPKEEIEAPTNPEVVEPPKEEIEIPKQPEVIEPPKENEGIEE